MPPLKSTAAIMFRCCNTQKQADNITSVQECRIKNSQLTELHLLFNRSF